MPPRFRPTRVLHVIGVAALLVACAEATRPPPSEPEPTSSATAPSAVDAAGLPQAVNSSKPIPPAGAVTSAARAVAAFPKLWPDTRAAIAPHAAERWSEVLAAQQKPDASKGDCGEYRKRIENTLGPDEYRTDLLYGELTSLEAGTTCWEVSLAHGFNTLLTYIRAKDGQLLVIWAPPEG